MAPRTDPPPLALPMVYFASGHLSLLTALWLVAVDAREIAGFFYHPRMFGVVHLVTLGWITTSILGATYLVAPMALRMPIRAGKLDWLVCVFTLIGVSGVVAHFFLHSYSGIAWSGAMLLVAFVLMAVRVFRALAGSKAPGAVRAHIVLAYTNLCLAATFGVLLAINKTHTILPGVHVNDVFGHVHYAAVGWATFMVMGVGYRLIPMYLPAGPPDGPSLWVSAAVLQTGVMGLATVLMVHPPLAPIFASCIALGLALFLRNVVRMLRDPRPPPLKLKRPDLGMLHTMQALLYLAITTVLGLLLAFSAFPDETRPDWIMVYGVCGLLGYLAQMVLGISMRLFPMVTWTQAWRASDYKVLPPSPFEMPVRPLQWATFVLWTLGVPALAYGLGHNDLDWVTAAAWTLFAGALCATVNSANVIRHARGAGTDS